MRRIISLLLVILTVLSVFMLTGGAMQYQDNDGAQDMRPQARGVWHRPNVTGEETTLEGMCSVLDKLQYAGINLIFLEVFYHGMTVFKTSSVEYYTGFENYDYGEYPDYLSAFVAEAKKRNIEVHAWVEDFYIGVKANRFVKNCPQWLLLNSKGSYRQSEGAASGGYIFLDPANPEVRKYLVDFYDEILTKFPDIKGINLDYIRYPISSRADDTGFTKSAMKQFSELRGWPETEYTIEGFISKLDTYGAHGDFTEFRADCVTRFVSDVCEMIKEEHPNALLSTAIFPNIEEAYNLKKQDFKLWIKEGYLDMVTPMAYYDDNNTLKNALIGMMKDCKDDVYCYAGLSSTYHNLSDAHVMQQIKVCSDVGADGFVFFGSQSILNKPEYIELMHRELGGVADEDILPHASVKELIDFIALPLMDELIKKAQNGEESEGRIKQLKETVDNIANGDMLSLSGLADIENELKLLVSYNLSAFVSQKNLEQVQNRFELLYRYVSIYIARANAKALLPNEPELPDVDDVPPADAPDIPDAPDDSTDIPEKEPDAGNEEKHKGTWLERFLAWLGELIRSFFRIFEK